ncbi:MAG: acyltransferase [Chitinophagaceae bacterium]|nr:MAG: acyltransferase [Chitinophagaceae bacterium]
MKAKHFAGLDGLRFISITFVVLHHLFTFKANFGLNQYDYPILGLIGLYGIHFFFMGSGFLITYLLLTEYTEHGKISLKHFFLRRLLRIWPAYYLLLVIALLVLLQLPFFRIPGTTDSYLASNFSKSNQYYFAFLPHVQPFFFPTGPYVHHTYTIGIEEQFYVIWGLLFVFLRKWIVVFFIAILICYPLLNVLHHYLHTNATGESKSIVYLRSGITYLQYSRFSTFAIGSLFGWAYFYQKSWIYLFKKAWLQLVVYLAIIVSIVMEITVPFLQNEYMAFLMACLMLIGTFKKESLINYNTGWLTYLGKISYGIYLFHIVAIVLAAKTTVVLFNMEKNLGVLCFTVVLTMLLSILFGHLSYFYFETIFLKLKRRFRKVQTGHD